MYCCLPARGRDCCSLHQPRQGLVGQFTGALPQAQALLGCLCKGKGTSCGHSTAHSIQPPSPAALVDHRRGLVAKHQAAAAASAVCSIAASVVGTAAPVALAQHTQQGLSQAGRLHHLHQQNSSGSTNTSMMSI
jgi:hypothetical protein